MADMVGDGEKGAFGGQGVGDFENAAIGGETAGHAGGQRDEAPVLAEDVLQPGLEAEFKTLGGVVNVVAHAFGGGLDGGEVVGVFLQEVGNRIGGAVVLTGFVGIGGQGGAALLVDVAIFVEQAHDGAGDGGIGLGEVANILIGEVGVGEQIIAEKLHQVAGQPGIVAFGQFARLDAEIAGDGKEQGHGNVAPVVLYQVQIAWRDAEMAGELGLGDAALAS